MRAIVQRVKKAQVEVIGQYTNAIERGILILCAFKDEDTEEKVKWAARRISKLRIFKDKTGKLNRSVLDEKGEALVIPNFTLYGNCKNGTRPDFSKSASGKAAFPLYELFIEKLKEYLPVKTGGFGQEMLLNIEADGPSTVVVEN